MAKRTVGKRLDELEQGQSEIKKLLSNHLHHHEMWMKYYFPALVGLANTALAAWIKMYGH